MMVVDREVRNQMLLGLKRFHRGDCDSDVLLQEHVRPACRSNDTAARSIAGTLMCRYCEETVHSHDNLDIFDHQLELFLKSDCERTEEVEPLKMIVGLLSFPIGIACAIVFGAIDGFWWGLPWLVAAIAIPAITLPWKTNLTWPFCNSADLAAATEALTAASPLTAGPPGASAAGAASS